MKKSLFLFICWANTFLSASAQETAQMVIGDWIFHPNYTLERRAKNYPGPKVDAPQSRFQQFKTLGAPIIFYEQAPTQRITDFMESETLPRTEFSIELWLLNHVNLPVGSLITARGKNVADQPAWLLGYFGNEIIFNVNSRQGEPKSITAPVKRGWKSYWGHLLGTYDGQTMKLYLNGELMAESEEIWGDLQFPAATQLELAGYFGNEPYMEISNLVKASRIYNYALNAEQIKTASRATNPRGTG
ncbi:MAG: LamG domain-containing protein [Bacteroidia bacterium]|nr:LamG domain-containing protein [Bacteroidia bacterium]